MGSIANQGKSRLHVVFGMALRQRQRQRLVKHFHRTQTRFKCRGELLPQCFSGKRQEAFCLTR